jgi:hypothetical protein
MHPTQSAILVALSMKRTRERILAFIEQRLPERIPGLLLQHTPAQELHELVERSIRKFQSGIMAGEGSKQR